MFSNENYLVFFRGYILSAGGTISRFYWSITMHHRTSRTITNLTEIWCIISAKVTLEMDGKWITHSERNLLPRKSGSTVQEKDLRVDKVYGNAVWPGLVNSINWNQTTCRKLYMQKYFLIIWKLFAIVGLHDNSIIWSNPDTYCQHEALLDAAVLANILENIKKWQRKSHWNNKSPAECWP